MERDMDSRDDERDERDELDERDRDDLDGLARKRGGPPKWKAFLGSNHPVVEEDAVDDEREQEDGSSGPGTDVKPSPFASPRPAVDGTGEEGEERDELESTPIGERTMLPPDGMKKEETPVEEMEGAKPKPKRTRRKKAEEEDGAPTPSKRRRGEYVARLF